MVNPAALALLKTSLGFYGDPPAGVEDLLASTLAQAEARIRRAGLTLDLTDQADLQFLVSFAEWLYSKRKTGEGMSRALRDEINDRKVARSTGGEP